MSITVQIANRLSVNSTTIYRRWRIRNTMMMREAVWLRFKPSTIDFISILIHSNVLPSLLFWPIRISHLTYRWKCWDWAN